MLAITIEILTIFPEIFESFLKTSLIKKSLDRGAIDIRLVNIRDFAEPPHYHVDDVPYGGGPGMLMKPEPLVQAIEAAKKKMPDARVILLTPGGKQFNQEKAEELAALPNLILVCGRYEGVDERVVDLAVDEEISIGDYVLMGGEIPAMAVTEAIVRLNPEILGNEESTERESFSESTDAKRLLEAPHYTRPPVFRGIEVPKVLLSGNHAQIEKWRQDEAVKRTTKRRPDLLS